MNAEKFRSGLTWRSCLAAIYTACVFTPAVLWLNLSTIGVGLGGAISFCTLYLFAELSKISGKPLSKQEAAIIFGPASVIGSDIFLTLIYRSWLVKQPMIKGIFGIDPSDIPTWWAPPAASPVFRLRTFYSPDMLLPLLIYVISSLLGLSGAIFFSLLLREMYIEGEKLPFPIENINVEAISSLTVREEERLEILSWGTLIAFVYAVLLYAIPIVSSAAGYTISLLPIPWIDFTISIQNFFGFSGIAFGIATDILLFTQGFVLPTNIVWGMLIGSIARFLIINPLLVNFGWTGWAKICTPGMNLTDVFQYSTLYFWLNPLIGVGFAIGMVPILWRARTFASSLKSLLKLKSASMGERISGPPFSLVVLIILYLLGSVGAFILYIVLVPGFPIWILAIYEFVLPLVTGIASGRMLGLTGQEAQIPYLNQLTILAGNLMGYEKIDAWFLPLQLHPGTGWLRGLKICQLTETSVSSWIKVTLIVLPISYVSGFIYTSIFWQMSPVPSNLYPAPAIMWPINAINTCVWIMRPTEFFDAYSIILSFCIFAVLISMSEFVHLPFNMVSIAVGLALPIPVSLAITVGLIVGKITAHVVGKEWFDKYRVTIAAGASLGEALAIVIGVTIALVIRSIFVRPY